MTDWIESHPQLAPAWCLFRFAQALQIHREMAALNLFSGARTVSSPKEDLWFYFAGAAYRDAVIEWCKVFGRREDWSHWRAAAGVSAEVIYPRFLAAAGMSEGEWEEVRAAIKGFRDKALAHHDEDLVEGVKEFPSLGAWAKHYAANRRPLIREIGRCIESFAT